jgi:rhomboid protease GluP
LRLVFVSCCGIAVAAGRAVPGRRLCVARGTLYLYPDAQGAGRSACFIIAVAAAAQCGCVERRRRSIPVSVEFEDVWVEVRRFDDRAEAEQHALVLLAMGIDCHLTARPTGIGLLVNASDLADARYQLDAYARENRRPSAPAVAMRPPGEGLDAALVFCALVVFVQAATQRGAFGRDWLALGQAQAGLIVGGEWWRAVTALGLHGDAEHLLSNLAIGSLFAILLAQTLGPGLTWLSILVAGSLGNLLNALIHPASHSSIGASTAVFAALGILAALTWKREAPYRRGSLRKWIPLAAGAMLVAFLGVGGERTDVGAHIAGFGVGCALGLVLHQARDHLPTGRDAQYGFGAMAFALFAGAWLIALSG